MSDIETTPILPAVSIVVGYLKTQKAVTDLAGERIAHKTPETLDEPWVRITQLDARNETGTREVEHLVSYYLQVDCYAGKANRYTEAEDLAIAVRAALVVIPKADLDGAVATDVGFLSMPSDPDPDMGRERMITDCEIFMHPA